MKSFVPGLLMHTAIELLGRSRCVMDLLSDELDIIHEEITTRLPEDDGTIITTISRARTCPKFHQRPPGLLEKNEKPEASTWMR